MCKNETLINFQMLLDPCFDDNPCFQMASCLTTATDITFWISKLIQQTILETLELGLSH